MDWECIAKLVKLGPGYAFLWSVFAEWMKVDWLAWTTLASMDV